jgi:hypothetical protein
MAAQRWRERYVHQGCDKRYFAGWRCKGERFTGNENGRCRTDPLTRRFRKFEALPASNYQLEGATSCRSFLLSAPAADFDLIGRLQLPMQRTKLLTPSVATAGVQVLVNCNDRGRDYARA